MISNLNNKIINPMNISIINVINSMHCPYKFKIGFINMLLTNMLTAMLINFISLLTIFMKFIIKRDLLHNFFANCSDWVKNKKVNTSITINTKLYKFLNNK